MESIPFVISKAKVNLYYTVKENNLLQISKKSNDMLKAVEDKLNSDQLSSIDIGTIFSEVQVLRYSIYITKSVYKSLSNEFNDQNNVQTSNINDCDLKYELFNAADLTTLELIEFSGNDFMTILNPFLASPDQLTSLFNSIEYFKLKFLLSNLNEMYLNLYYKINAFKSKIKQAKYNQKFDIFMNDLFRIDNTPSCPTRYTVTYTINSCESTSTGLHCFLSTIHKTNYIEIYTLEPIVHKGCYIDEIFYIDRYLNFYTKPSSELIPPIKLLDTPICYKAIQEEKENISEFCFLSDKDNKASFRIGHEQIVFFKADSSIEGYLRASYTDLPLPNPISYPLIIKDLVSFNTPTFSYVDNNGEKPSVFYPVLKIENICPKPEEIIETTEKDFKSLIEENYIATLFSLSITLTLLLTLYISKLILNKVTKKQARPNNRRARNSEQTLRLLQTLAQAHPHPHSRRHH